MCIGELSCTLKVGQRRTWVPYSTTVCLMPLKLGPLLNLELGRQMAGPSHPLVCLCLPWFWGYRHTANFSVGAGDLNSDPHAS